MSRFILYVLLCTFAAPVFAQSNFARVEKSWAWKFPRDHGRHSEFQTEWWYFTGNLKTEGGRRFGYELTFFRQALAPAILPRASPWAFRDVYVAHFALTDVEKEKFHYDQKVSRGTLDLAGADSAALAVHLGDWLARQETPGNGNIDGKIRLRAASAFGQIDLTLTPMLPPIFHGALGLLPNISLSGDAAYYYSLAALQTAGQLEVGDEAFRMHGSSWMDHEFFTPIGNFQMTKWDWVSLHLSDSTAVMLARLHHETPFSIGTFVDRDGRTQTLTSREVALEPQSWWTSPASGGKYPLAWKIKFLGYELQLRTPVKNQELDARRTTGNFYWEGCVEAAGKKGKQDISGEGYLEMTGYTK